MNIRASLVLSSAAVAVIALGIAWRQHVELVALRAQLAGAAEGAAFEEQWRSAERANRVLEAQLAALRQDDGAAAAAAAREDAGGTGGRSRGAGSGPSRGWWDNPQAQALRSIQQRGALDARYAALFRTLDFAPAQLDRLKTLLAERQSTLMDVMSAAREQGLDPWENREAVRALIASAQSGTDASLRALLGDSGYAEFQAFEQSAPHRAVVSQLEQRLSYGEAPLTSAQAGQLMQILAATSPADPNALPFGYGVGRGGGPGLGMGMGRGPSPAPAPITADTVVQAGAILSAPQLAALEQLQREQQAHQQLVRTVGDAQKATPPDAPGSGAKGGR